MNNLDLVGSFLIGGFILALLFGLLFYNADFAQSKTINEITISSATNAQDIINYDFNKIGYRAGSNSIQQFDSSSITFSADLNNDGSVETINYKLEDGLKRTIVNNSDSYIIPGVEKFSITGYDSNNIATTALNLIENVLLKVTFNNQDMITDNTFFAVSYFEARYYKR